MGNKEFEREDRYAVIKYKKLTNNQWTLVPELLEKFDKARVDCVVVEKDWPEYHLVWAMIEHRMAGKPVPDFNLWRQADELQQRLADAERRNMFCESMLRQIMPCLAMSTNTTAPTYMRQIDAALTKPEEAKS